MFDSQAKLSPKLAVVVGTNLQKRILSAIYEKLQEKLYPLEIVVLSLDSFYQFDVTLDEFSEVIKLRSLFNKPWYDRGVFFKLISLPGFAWNFIRISRSCTHFVFFVDTGLLERSAIMVLNRLGCHTIVLQDAMKFPPRFASKRSLLWFGGGNAELYLLIGERCLPMVQRGETRIVGSPLYNNNYKKLPRGKKILIFNQCFARYGEVSEDFEYLFMKQVVDVASQFGEVELRLHPHNSPERYEDIVSEKVEVSYQKQMAYSLESAGILLAVNSSAILEALAVGLTVITLDWYPSPFNHQIEKGIIPCESIELLSDKLSEWRKKGCAFGNFSEDEILHELHAQIAFSGCESVDMIVNEIDSFIH